MDLYLITPPQTGRDELPVVRQLLDRGLYKLHIRKPGYSDHDYRQYIESIPAPFRARLVLHGAGNLLSDFPGTGLHLRSDDRKNAALLRQVLQHRPASLSSSFHGWEEMMEEATPFDYVFISPVFDSISKQGYKAAIDLSGRARLAQWATQHTRILPSIVALGGVSAAGIPALQQNGFDGAALLGAIWESADPIASYEAIVGSL
jgi:thiamine-phosphate pyrophosphorylase